MRNGTTFSLSFQTCNLITRSKNLRDGVITYCRNGNGNFVQLERLFPFQPNQIKWSTSKGRTFVQENFRLIYVQKCTLIRFMNCMIDITRCPLNLNTLQNTHNSIKHDVIWKRQKGLIYMKYSNSELGAFLDISVFTKNHRTLDLLWVACHWKFDMGQNTLKRETLSFSSTMSVECS